MIEFAHKSDMKRALEKMDGKEMNGKRIKLMEERKWKKLHADDNKDDRKSKSKSPDAKKRKRSKRSRSSSGSRSRSRSKSRSRTPKRKVSGRLAG